MRNLFKALMLGPVLCLFAACGAENVGDVSKQDVPEVTDQDTSLGQMDQAKADPLLDNAMIMKHAEPMETNAMKMKQSEPVDTNAMKMKQAEPADQQAHMKSVDEDLVSDATPEQIHSVEQQYAALAVSPDGKIHFIPPDQQFAPDGKIHFIPPDQQFAPDGKVHFIPPDPCSQWVSPDGSAQD